MIFPDLPGAYQYIVNKDLPTLGVLRTLYRLDNTTFTHGRTNIKDEILPAFSEILAATKVQDETWERADGTFITKYDWSTFIRELDFHGIYGDNFGSWYIRPGRDYFNGNHLKQELTVHRESATGDAVELNVVHGSHYQVSSSATFPQGKLWGPWLWYLVSPGPYLYFDCLITDIELLNRIPAQKKMQQTELSKNSQLGLILGSITVTTSREVSYLAHSFYRMVVLLQVHQYSWVTTTPTFQL